MLSLLSIILRICSSIIFLIPSWSLFCARLELRALSAITVGAAAPLSLRSLNLFASVALLRTAGTAIVETQASLLVSRPVSVQEVEQDPRLRARQSENGACLERDTGFCDRETEKAARVED
jgi:hypothetical protein